MYSIPPPPCWKLKAYAFVRVVGDAREFSQRTIGCCKILPRDLVAGARRDAYAGDAR